MRPVPAGRPRVSFVQLTTPSVLRKIPPTSPPPVASGPATNDHGVRRRAYSAAYTVSGFDGSMTTSPAPVLSASAWSTHFQVLPPSDVLYSPRSAVGVHKSPAAAAN